MPHCAHSFGHTPTDQYLNDLSSAIMNMGADTTTPGWIKVYKQAMNKPAFKALAAENLTYSDCIRDETAEKEQDAAVVVTTTDLEEEHQKKLKQNAAKYKNMDELIAGSKVRFDDHQFIYNNNIFKMIYLSSGILTMSFLIFKVV
jgi:hypothetical protein